MINILPDWALEAGGKFPHSMYRQYGLPLFRSHYVSPPALKTHSKSEGEGKLVPMLN
jgi:hypothetical protein